MDRITWIPRSDREKRVTKRLGNTDWAVVEKLDSVVCFDGAAGRLIEKDNHKRWIRETQVFNKV